VTFPEGTIIGLAKGRLPVHVAFSSDKPLAFTAPLDLMDEAGMRYSLPVTAVADNSLATHAAFWEVGAKRSGFPNPCFILMALESKATWLDFGTFKWYHNSVTRTARH
jgi:hypothetical protein